MAAKAHDMPIWLRAGIVLLVAVLYFAWLHRGTIVYYLNRLGMSKAAQIVAGKPRESAIPRMSYRKLDSLEFMPIVIFGIVAITITTVFSGRLWLFGAVMWLPAMVAFRLLMLVLDQLFYDNDQVRDKLDFIYPFYELRRARDATRLEIFINGAIYWLFWISFFALPFLTFFADQCWAIGGVNITAWLKGDRLTYGFLFTLSVIYTFLYVRHSLRQYWMRNMDNEVRFYTAFRVLYFIPVYFLFLWLPARFLWLHTDPAATGTTGPDAAWLNITFAVLPFLTIGGVTLIGAYRHVFHADGLMRARLDIADGLLAALEIPPEVRGVRQMAMQRLFSELQRSVTQGVYRYYFVYLLISYYGLDLAAEKPFFDWVAAVLTEMEKARLSDDESAEFLMEQLNKWSEMQVEKLAPQDRPNDDDLMDLIFRRLSVVFLLWRFQFRSGESVDAAVGAAFASDDVLMQKGHLLGDWDIYCAHIYDLLVMFMMFHDNDPHRVLTAGENSGKEFERLTRTALEAISAKIKRHKSDRDSILAPATTLGLLGFVAGIISFWMTHK